ncbi:hypothetical protein [Mycobacterium attenuatum]|uniref:hypothetical protein n=1 Tax=Mycobacterium attenuatum TaxID=2341086 RepID=UPI000F16E64A|nr:hypothetical protein [Mycobacterium attenuatum]VBA62452.1 hypothetical protein LAUMK41_05843 [Mycobacterium attenuatum]
MPLIPTADRTAIFTSLGAGHAYQTIRALLETIAVAKLAIPEELAERIAEWAGAYTFHEDAARLQDALLSVAGLPRTTNP